MSLSLYKELISWTKIALQQEGHVFLPETKPVAKPLPVPPIQRTKELKIPSAAKNAICSIKEESSPPPPATEKVAPTPYTRQPVEALQRDCWIEIAPLLQKEFPKLALIQEIPTDEQARRPSSSWRESVTNIEIILLSFEEPQRHTFFLNQIANAIILHGRQAKVLPAKHIESEGGWEQLLSSPSLRLIIASEYATSTVPRLMKHYQESSKQAEQFLAKIPLLPLADLSLYLREPMLKASLWKAIKRYLSNLL